MLTLLAHGSAHVHVHDETTMAIAYGAVLVALIVAAWRAFKPANQ